MFTNKSSASLKERILKYFNEETKDSKESTTLVIRSDSFDHEGYCSGNDNDFKTNNIEEVTIPVKVDSVEDFLQRYPRLSCSFSELPGDSGYCNPYIVNERKKLYDILDVFRHLFNLEEQAYNIRFDQNKKEYELAHCNIQYVFSVKEN
jgi:hypothetical protein